MRHITIRYIGGLKEPPFREIAGEYERRLSGYCRLENAEARDEAALRAALGAASGSARNAPPGAAPGRRSLKIALCVEGEALSSEGFARLLEDSAAAYPSVEFVIGGAEGLSEETKALCGKRFSLSKMTFPHRIARILLLEQIYRAFTIINNEKYHK